MLEVKDLRVHYYVEAGAVKAVDGVSFSLDEGTKLGLVGESGSGKSTMALALMRMVQPPARIVGGKILLDGYDLATANEEEMRRIRLSQISMIPQGAMNALHPLLRVERQIMDGIVDHESGLSKAKLKERVYELLESVELNRRVSRMYPHQLSGGMKQRVAAAASIALHPKLVIADEPTSALDVVIQRQVMETISRLQSEMNLSIILIGHDMGLMAQFVDRLAVMYAGKLMELGDIRAMFAEPLHPYTLMLIRSLPRLENKGEFSDIPGITPSLLNPPSGCVFHTRCPYATGSVGERCRTVVPDFCEIRPGRWIACHLDGEIPS
ncbi:MAG: ABC transporter ATP-binding protein [Chloroflexi bacterium]|nr:ABC transporter ATP-binding protein [Chloroflexota bacterium]